MKRAYFLLFVALWSAWINARAAQVPVTPMQNALSGIINATIAKRGFTPEDIRIANTTWRASSALLDSVVAATNAKNARLAALGRAASKAGTWGAIAAALIGASYALGWYGAEWYYSKDGTVKTGKDPASVNTPAGLPPPTDIWCYANVCSASKEAACSFRPKSNGESQGRNFVRSYTPVGSECHAIWTFSDTGQQIDVGSGGPPEHYVGNSTFCPGIGLTASGGKCSASNFPEPGSAPIVEDADAAANMSSSDRARPLPVEPIVELANDAWRSAASKPGYDGIPYDGTNPITNADAGNWRDANPGYWPTMGDFVTPQQIVYNDPGTGLITNPLGGSSSPSGTTSPAAQSPFGLPGTKTPQSSIDPGTTTPNTGTNPSTQPVQNLGPDPGIGAPGLEPIPTAQQIIAPTQNIFPTLKNFVVPSVDAQCPTWDVPVLGKLIAFKDHCPLLERVRPNLYAAMAVIYALMALFIVLRT